MNKKIIVLGALFALIWSITFSLGVFNNPTFNINDFCLNLSTELVGWALGITIFQYYYNAKVQQKEQTVKQESSFVSLADELLKLKKMLESGDITPEEFEVFKKVVLKSML